MWERLRAWTQSREVIDLTDDLTITFQLLDDTLAWRHRLVEHAHLRYGDHLSATSAYQVELPPALMSQYVPNGHGRRVRLLLPLMTKPKRPLLQFSIDGPGGAPGQLLLRSSVSVIQAAYLREVIHSSPAAAVLREGLPSDLLEAICAFTPAVFEEYLAQAPPLDAYHVFLEDGLGFAVPRRDVVRWVQQQEASAAALCDALGEPNDPLSSSEQVLMALPALHHRLGGAADVTALLDRYHHAVRVAARSGDDYLLTALADYGRRWECIVELEVPLEEPCQVKLHETRPVTVDRGGWVRPTEPLPFREARSGHLEIRLDDPHVEIAEFEVRDAGTGEDVAIPVIESVRYTRESLALYSSQSERPYYLDVALKLRVIRGIRLTYWFVAAITLVAVLVATLVPTTKDLVDTLALLTVPTTFAVALLLVRESSAIAVRLQRSFRTLVAGLAVSLWIVSLARILIQL